MENLTIILQFIAAMAGGCAWLWLIWLGKADPGSFVNLLQVFLGGLAVHLINRSNASTITNQAKPTTPSKEGGYSSPFFLLTLIAIFSSMALLTACATGYRTALDVTTAQTKAADDNTVLALRTAICALPLSAILRNADIIPGIKALCLPGGDASNPNGILPIPQGPVQVQIVPSVGK